MLVFIDPLISRKHARIHCDGVRATLEDLESRNGTRINGILTSGPHTLRDGDRIGMGSTEIIVRLLDAEDPMASGSGTVLSPFHPACRHLSAEPVCPHCGRNHVGLDEDSTSVDVTAEGRWSMGMLIEMLGKAMLSERVLDADRLMREIAMDVDERLRSGQGPTPEEMQVLREAAAWLAKAQINDDWIAWITSVQGASQNTRSPPAGPA